MLPFRKTVSAGSSETVRDDVPGIEVIKVTTINSAGILIVPPREIDVVRPIVSTAKEIDQVAVPGDGSLDWPQIYADFVTQIYADRLLIFLSSIASRRVEPTSGTILATPIPRDPFGVKTICLNLRHGVCANLRPILESISKMKSGMTLSAIPHFFRVRT